MAEVLGVAVNIAAVVQLAAQIVKLSYSYVRDVKNAPKLQKQYLQEVSGLMDVLFRVEQVLMDAESLEFLPARPKCLSEEGLKECHAALLNLQVELLKRKSRLTRPFQDREIRPQIDMLHKFRENFSTYLSSCILATANATHKKVSLLSQEQDRNMLLSLVSSIEIPLKQKPAPCHGTGMWFLSHKVVVDWMNGLSPIIWCHGPPGVGKSFLVSVLLDSLQGKQEKASVAYFFCDFSSQEKHTTLNIVLSLLRQLVEKCSSREILTLKDDFQDPGLLQSVEKVSDLIIRIGSLQPVYLILDAVDEMKDASELLNHLSKCADSGLHVLVTSRYLPHIQAKMSTATQLEITGDRDDLVLYVQSRLKESDFREELGNNNEIIRDITSLTGNLLLLARLTLDEVLDLTTVSQIRKTLRRKPQGLNEAFQGSIERINAQSIPRKALAHRVLAWTIYAKRRLRVEELTCAFAVSEEGIDPDDKPGLALLLRVCVGLVAVNPIDNTVGLVHTSAYEYLQKTVLEKSADFDIAQACLNILCLKSLIPKACKSSSELVKRFNNVDFLDYAAHYWGEHLQDQENERLLQELILKLLEDDDLRGSAFQAFLFRTSHADSGARDELFNAFPSDHQEVHVAAQWNLIKTLGILLEAGTNPSAKDSHGWTPLHWACCNGRVLAAKILLDHKAEVNSQDAQRWTPLFWATFTGNLDLTCLLLSHGADHQIQCNLGWTALHWAISGGHSAVTQKLLEYNSGTRYFGKGFSHMSMSQIQAYSEDAPIILAGDTQNLEVFEVLIEHLQERASDEPYDALFNQLWRKQKFQFSVSKNLWRTMAKAEAHFSYTIASYDFSLQGLSASQRKSTLLVSAIRDRQLSAVQLLLEAGADAKSPDVLHLAACERDSRYVKYLLQHGADVNVTRFCLVPLHQAILHGHLETAEALIKGGSDVNRPVLGLESLNTGGYYSKVLSGVSIPLRQDRPLQDSRVFAPSPIISSPRGSTFLIDACCHLFNGHAHFDSKHNKQGEVTLQLARLLLSYGADVKAQNASGMTALHYAVLMPYFPLIKLLVDCGSPVDAVNENGCNVLHLLARCDERSINTEELSEVVQLLISSFEANDLMSPSASYLDRPTLSILASDEELPELNVPRTAIELALMGGYWKMTKALASLGAKLPTGLEWTVILDQAVSDLDLDIVDLLTSHGAVPSPTAIKKLVLSIIVQFNKKELSNDDLETKFEGILSRIVPLGANINHYWDRAEQCMPFSREIKEIAHEGTPLTIAARKLGSAKILQTLLSFGADPYSTSTLTFDPILTAAVFGSAGDLSCLLQFALLHPNDAHWSRYLSNLPEDMDPTTRVCLCLGKSGLLGRKNVQGDNLLYLAIQECNSSLIEALESQILAADTKGNREDEAVLNSHAAEQRELNANGDRLMNHAITNRNEPLLVHLVEAGIDPQWKVRQEGRFAVEETPLIFWAAENGLCHLVHVLLAHGAQVNASDPWGWQPLHVASLHGYPDIVRALVKSGADVHATASSSRPALRWNRDDIRDFQAHHLAAACGNSIVLSILLAENIDIHAKADSKVTGDGPTALHLALRTGRTLNWHGNSLDDDRLQAAQLLVDAGATVSGVLSKFSLAQALMFQKFPGLWDALRAGDVQENSSRAVKSKKVGHHESWQELECDSD
ncbi:ankyrin repeat-containing protein [Penicillium malachiteum]|uniref:Ankyrin repeat-containing protein n=1 Tax=Penicillium malachiteum TaxID=1324776 RepID=A0AAD6HHD7_9EURO|nr:ankyrin repeat-containing protein [Penicillium malachiteum]